VGWLLLKHYVIHGCGLAKVRSPAGATDFSLLHIIRIGCGAHTQIGCGTPTQIGCGVPTQTPIQVCWGSFSVVKL
jgi:hypothetical protein